MKPFSAFYFVKENRKRSVLLIFMFVLSYIAYLGGLYVTNISSMFEYYFKAYSKYAVIQPKEDDVEFQQFDEVVETVLKTEGIVALHSGVTCSLLTDSIMGFHSQYGGRAFCSVEDFKTFCRVVGIQCDFEKLKGGSLIMSRLAANNRGMKLGDKLREEDEEWVVGDYTLDAIIEEDGYSYYYIDDGTNGTNYSYILLADELSEHEFSDYIENLKWEQKVAVYDREYLEESIDRQFASFNYLYAFIIVLLAIVMAVTINAAFVGMYQHRQSEFAIYRAIGISNARIIGKVTKELLLMDGIGIIIGGSVMLLAIYLFNHLYLIPKGLMLFYYHPLALLGMIFCNLLVLIPLLVTRSRQLLKADICDY